MRFIVLNQGGEDALRSMDALPVPKELLAHVEQLLSIGMSSRRGNFVHIVRGEACVIRSGDLRKRCVHFSVIFECVDRAGVKNDDFKADQAAGAYNAGHLLMLSSLAWHF